MPTVVKLNYRTANQGGQQSALGSVNYYAHRRDVDGQVVSRLGFSRYQDGLDTQAMKDVIAQADGTYYYRMVLSPGANHDTNVDLKEWTRDLMLELEGKHGEFPYVAIEHCDQTDFAHVHVVMVLDQKLTTPELDKLRETGTELYELRRDIYEPVQTKAVDKQVQHEQIAFTETYISGHSDEPDDQTRQLRKDRHKSLDR
jgi:hypothetical protein